MNAAPINWATELGWWTPVIPQVRGSVLIVDSDRYVCEELAGLLTSHGFTVHTASAPSGSSVLALAAKLRPDVVLMEIELPGMNGFEVLRQLRAECFDGAVVFLTARVNVADKIKGLMTGATDYITKPYSPEEVVTRVRAILRRTFREIKRSRRDGDEPRKLHRWVVADLELDESTYQVWKTGVAVALSPTEFRLLQYFMQNSGTTLPYANIIDHVWRGDESIGASMVRTYVKYLRRKLETKDSQLLHTVRGVGYTLRAPQ